MKNIDVILDVLSEKIKSLELELSIKEYKIKQLEDQKIEKRPTVVKVEEMRK